MGGQQFVLGKRLRGRSISCLPGVPAVGQPEHVAGCVTVARDAQSVEASAHLAGAAAFGNRRRTSRISHALLFHRPDVHHLC
jgi:hypothetical protein